MKENLKFYFKFVYFNIYVKYIEKGRVRETLCTRSLPKSITAVAEPGQRLEPVTTSATWEAGAHVGSPIVLYVPGAWQGAGAEAVQAGLKLALRRCCWQVHHSTGP